MIGFILKTNNWSYSPVKCRSKMGKCLENTPKTRAVSGLYLLLHQIEWTSASSCRSTRLLWGITTKCSSDVIEAWRAWIDNERSRCQPKYQGGYWCKRATIGLVAQSISLHYLTVYENDAFNRLLQRKCSNNDLFNKKIRIINKIMLERSIWLIVCFRNRLNVQNNRCAWFIK